jgi:hypothetical protein
MGKHATLLNGIALNVPFNPKNVKIFLEGIIGSLEQMRNLDRIAQDVEQPPVKATQPNESNQNFNSRVTIYLQRKRLAVDILKSPILKAFSAGEADSEIYYNAIQAMSNPFEIINKIRELSSPQGSVEDANRVLKWVSITNRDEHLSSESHNTALKALFVQIQKSNVSMVQMNAIFYLNSLSSRYDTIIKKYLAMKVFTQDMIFEEVRAHDLITQHAKQGGNPGIANAYAAAI